MYLHEEEIFDSDGYVYSYSKATEQTMDKLLSAGFSDMDGVLIVALIIEIGHYLGTDLKRLTAESKITDKQRLIADDVYLCLTKDFGTKYTAAQFAEKYCVSDTTVKKYFKMVYGYGFKEYQTKVRMEWAAAELVNTNEKISVISDCTGYAKQTKFTKAFKNFYGVTPSEYRRNARRCN